jgi:hypothetical protein
MVGVAGLGLGALDLACRDLRLGTRIVRGWPFSSKNTRTSPSSLVSPTACRRIDEGLAGVDLGLDLLARFHAVEEGAVGRVRTGP